MAGQVDQRAKELIKQGDYLFMKRSSLLSLWQEQADNFYPQRADFTTSRNLGDDFASNITTSYPVLIARDLGNSLSSMLRPNNKDWFEMSIAREERLDSAGKGWLEHKTAVMRRAISDRASLFTRAVKEGDMDFTVFGQCAISVELNRARTALLYRCWHLRDIAWAESNEGKVENIHRKWKPTARELQQTFGEDNLHDKVKEVLNDVGKNPYQQFNCRHIIIPTDQYEGYGTGPKSFNTPYVSIYIDIENEKIMEEVGIHYPFYTIPRWQTVSGSQYAYSPATIAALPDARLIQAISQTLLEAGEKAVNPPMVATEDVVRSDISIFAGGVTWVSEEYNERDGSALRPIDQNYSGLPFGQDMREDIKASIMEAFYINQLNMPPVGGPDMTAFEVGQRVQEYVRNALPLFEPMEMEYNGSLMENTFEVLQRNGAFGSAFDMPQSLQDQDVQFKFESPLREAVEKQKGNTFAQASELLSVAAQSEPSTAKMVNASVALRDALDGVGVPQHWIRPPEEMAEIEAQAAAQQEQAQQLAMLEQGGKAAASGAKAAKDLTEVVAQE